jgi:hypothetical protein
MACFVKNVDQLFREHYLAFRRFLKFGGKKRMLSRLKSSWKALFFIEAKQGWLSLERDLLERTFGTVCGKVQPIGMGPEVEERFKLKALSWIRLNLAFSSTMESALLHCLMDSKIACNARKGVDHLILPESRSQCEDDAVSVHFKLRNLVSWSEHPATRLELNLRIVLEEDHSGRRLDALHDLVRQILHQYDQSEYLFALGCYS